MKTKTKVLELSHEDLVDLFSTAMYGSYMFGLDYDSIEYHSLPNADPQHDCLEDKVAKLLLAGKTVAVADLYAEDDEDTHGKLKHYWDKEWEHLCYEVSLKDIIKGVQKCFDKVTGDDSYLSKYAQHFAKGEGDMDNPEAESIMQVIIFGEEIYG